MVLLDPYYIENQSVMFGLEIPFGTIIVVMIGKGAYWRRIKGLKVTFSSYYL
jgi:hypothetical protein